MQIWFWAAVAGAVLAGFSNFCFKVAAKRDYNSELFIFYGGFASVIVSSAMILVVQESVLGYGIIAWITVFAGMVASTGGIMKTYALRHIDSTIFFPLFKLLSPLLAVIAGIIFFGESFSGAEWIGIVMGLTVPLLLINNAERGRQANLTAGLVLVLLTAVSSAFAAALNKYAIVVAMPFLAVLFYATIGVFVGSLLVILVKRGAWRLREYIYNDTSVGLIWYSVLRAVTISASMAFVLYAYQKGALGIVQTIHSMYILIPIILAVVFYQEHWNLQKMLAVVLSILALMVIH